MMDDFILIGSEFAMGGFRTLIAVLIGYFFTLFLPAPISNRLHPKEFWRGSELTYQKIIIWFIIGAAILTVFYTLVDTSKISSMDY